MIKKIKSLKTNQEFMKYFSNTSYLFFDKIFKMGIGFFVIIYLTRYLGPEQFGILSYSQSFVSIFMAFASLGISQIIVRDIVSHKHDKNELLGTAFIMMLISAIVSICSIFLLNSMILSTDQSILFTNILSFTILFNVLYIIMESYFQAKVLSKYIVYISNISFMISSILKLLMIYFEFPLINFIYLLLFDSIFLALGSIYIYKIQNSSVLAWKFNIDIARHYLKVSFPLLMVAISAFIYTRIDQIMLKHMIGDEAVGIYAAAIRVSELFYFIPGIIATSIYPKLIKAKEDGEARYLLLLEKVYRLVVWISLPIILSISLGSNFIIDILYGEKFAASSEILVILSCCMLFASIGSVFVKMLYIEHFEKKYLYKSIFGVFVNLVLNYILIGLYGIKGAAYATLITLFFVNYVYDLFDKDLHKFYYLKIKCFMPINLKMRK